MRPRSILEPRYTLTATVITALPANTDVDVAQEVKGGHWETVQDDDTGALTRVWIEDSAVVPSPNAEGSLDLTGVNRFDIECDVRGFPNVGFRSSANTESFLNGTVEYMEVIQINFPAKYSIGRRQLITNIRNKHGKILWLEEELGTPTIFEVQGVNPNIDPFGKHVDNLAVLKRSERQ